MRVVVRMAEQPLHEPLCPTVSLPPGTAVPPSVTPTVEYRCLATASSLSVHISFPDSAHDLDDNLEEVLTALLLDRLHRAVARQPSDAHHRAIYHLAKAKECLRHELAAPAPRTPSIREEE